MTKLLERAVAAARRLPDDVQDDIAEIVLRLAEGEAEAPSALTPEESTAIAVSKAAASRGDFATEDEVRAVWAKHRL